MGKSYSAAGDDRDYEDKIVESLKKKQSPTKKQAAQPVSQQHQPAHKVGRWEELDTAQCMVKPPAELAEDAGDDGTMSAGVAMALIDGRDYVQYVEISAETNETLWMRGDKRTWVQVSSMDIGVDILGIRFHRGFLGYVYAAIFFFLLAFVILYIGDSSSFFTNVSWIGSIVMFTLCCNKAVKQSTGDHLENSGWVKISQPRWRALVREAAHSYENDGFSPAEIRAQLDEGLRQTRNY